MLLESIGRGGMGRVWRGAVRSSGEAVAVKVLDPELAADPGVVARFLQERGILVGLDHPHLVGVHDLVAEGDTLAIVMDLVRGPDLRRYVAERGPLTPAFSAGVMAQVLTGLAAVHSVGIVHRDLKPENILLDLTQDGPPRALLSDFGIARLTAGPGLTRTTGLIGTPDYMAPEMADQIDAGPPADIYAAGIVLYELLAGRTPFAGGSAVAILRRHVDEAPLRPDGVPDALWQLLSAMLAKRPEQRPDAASAADRLVELVPTLLAAAQAGSAVAADADPQVTRLPGHHPLGTSGDPAAGGTMAVPMPLGGTGPQRATAAAGDQQLTMLPGSTRHPLVPGPSTEDGKPVRARPTLLMVAGVMAAILVALLGAGLLARSWPKPRPRPLAASAGTGGPSAVPSLPPEGRVNDGAFDTDFNRPGEQRGGFDVDSGVTATSRVDADGTHFLRIAGRAGGDETGVFRKEQPAVVSPTRYLTVSIRARAVGAQTVTASLWFGAFPPVFHGYIPTVHPKLFRVGAQWTEIVSLPVTPAPDQTLLFMMIRYVGGPAVGLDLTDVSYTYHSGPTSAPAPSAR